MTVEEFIRVHGTDLPGLIWRAYAAHPTPRVREELDRLMADLTGVLRSAAGLEGPGTL